MQKDLEGFTDKMCRGRGGRIRGSGGKIVRRGLSENTNTKDRKLCRQRIRSHGKLKVGLREPIKNVLAEFVR